MKIILLRHGKPVAPILEKISATAFRQWVVEYNAAGLSPSSIPASNVLNHAQACNVIVCSNLPRSIESAKALNTGNVVFSSSIFNEAGLPTTDGYKLKLSPKVWAVMLRVAWFFGYSKNSESFAEAKKRAVEAVQKLTEIAREHDSVLFVGHGVFNRILANELRRSGWSGPNNPGSKHWSMAVYECENDF